MNSSRIPLVCSLLTALCSLAAFGQGSPSGSPAPTPTPTPTVTLVGSDATGLKFTVSVADVRLVIPLELDQGTIRDFTASVDDFSGPDNSVVPAKVTLDGRPANAGAVISQKDRPRLEISATLPAALEYKSRIVLFYNDKRWPSVPLVVTRSRNAAPLHIDVIESGRAMRSSAADADVRFNVRETNGQAVTLYVPALVNFALKESDKTQKQARYTRFEMILPAAGSAPARRVSTPFTLEPLASREVVMRITGIQDPGEYNGLIRLSSADTTPAEKTFTLFVKDTWVYAFAWIFLGVLASYVIRRYTKEERPRLEALRRVSDLRESLEQVKTGAGTLAAIEATVIAELSQRLDKVERDLARGRKDTAAALDEIEKKIQALHDWLVLGRDLNRIEPDEIVATPRGEWEELADVYFLKLGATDDVLPRIKAIRKKANDAIKAWLLGRIDDFEKVADAYKNGHQELAKKIDEEVKRPLEAARTDANELKFPEASEKLKRARAAYADILAQELEAALAGPAPVGFQEKEWRSLGAELVEETRKVGKERDPDKALRIYQAANERYVQALLSALGRDIEVVQGEIDRSALPDKKNRAESLDTAARDLKAASRLVPLGRVDEAFAKYASASRLVQDAWAALGKREVSLTKAAAAPFRGALPAGADIPPAAEIPRPVIPPRSVADRITALIDRYDLLLNLGLLAIATVLGMKLLWADDPIWGGWKSYVIAFLWGLGLQQVAGMSFEGLPAMTRKLTE